MRSHPLPVLVASALLVLGSLAFAMWAPVSASAPTCVTGRLEYAFPSAERGGEMQTAPGRSSTVQLWGATSPDESPMLLDERTVGTDGTFEVCTEDAAAIHGVDVRFRAENGRYWRVIADGATDATEFSALDVPESLNASARLDLGSVSVPAELAGAWKIVDAVTALYEQRATDSPCWSALEMKDCATLTFVWPAADPDDAGYWDPESGNVVLGQEDPISRHLILHEAGHWWQNELYGGEFPEVTGCTPHYVDQPSSRSCAWTEGFADAVAAHILGDREFVTSDGSAIAFEAADGAPWPGGDETQGNVASALLDLWKSEAEEPGGWGTSIAFMTGHPSPDFCSYVIDRYDPLTENADDVFIRLDMEPTCRAPRSTPEAAWNEETPGEENYDPVSVRTWAHRWRRACLCNVSVQQWTGWTTRQDQ